MDSIDLRVDEGEFFSLLGPSGCGKTTTLRMISGLETPTSGRVALFDEDVTDVPPQERRTNLVFQNLALFPHMTVEENILFGLKHEEMSEGEKDERVTEMLEIVDLSGFESRSVTELSGGQQQRVALARSLAKQPAVLLLDEPLGSLDRKLRQQMQFELKEIQEELGMTFFYVTHDQEVAMTMSDRMAVMQAGEIIQVGGPSEIYEHPTNSFVADFIGDANFMDGSLQEKNDQTFFVAADYEFPVTDEPSGTSGRLVLRPENISIGSQAMDTEFTFEVEVVDRVNQGHTVLFDVVLDSGTEMTVRQKNLDIEEGDKTTMGFDEDDYAIIEA
ncbi:MAG: ABC transporter ATP-binding protein [Halodesulfurarchaeum sp.]